MLQLFHYLTFFLTTLFLNEKVVCIIIMMLPYDFIFQFQKFVAFIFFFGRRKKISFAHNVDIHGFYSKKSSSQYSALVIKKVIFLLLCCFHNWFGRARYRESEVEVMNIYCGYSTLATILRYSIPSDCFHQVHIV